MKKIPGWVKIYRRNHAWFKAASGTLEVLWQAREGGIISSTLAGVTAVGKVIDTLYPSEGPWEKLRTLGLIEMDYAIGGYLCDVLLKSNVQKYVMSADLSSKAWVWFDEDDTPFVGAIYSGNQFLDGPYILPGKEESFLKLIRDIVWTSSELMFVAAKHEAHHWKSSGKFRTEPMNRLAEYIGEKPSEWYIDRIKKYPPGPRTIMFAGPTGVGKSILARHIGANIGHSNRTLKISSEVLQDIRCDELLSLVRVLQPTVLLLDDLDLKEKNNTQRFLATLEALRDPRSLVIVTMMTNHKEKEKKPVRGSWHFPGMRPDRIDEIFVMGLPSSKGREKLLRHYASKFGLYLNASLLKQMVRITNGLSGAYIMELVRRVSVHGVETWREEAHNILMVAPAPVVEGPEKDKSAPEILKTGNKAS